MKTKALFFCILLLLPTLCPAAEEIQQQQSPAAATVGSARESAVTTNDVKEIDYAKLSDKLLSISRLKNKLAQQIETKKKSSQKSDSDNEKKVQQEELNKLGEKLTQTSLDFEKIATGVDTSKFQTPEKTAFDWKAELFSLIRPGITELKRLTVEARRKSELLNQQETYRELLPVAEKADKNLKDLVQNIKDPAVKKELELLVPQWENTVNQLKNSLDVTRMELETIAEKKLLAANSGKESLKRFFRTRGLYIAIAITTCCVIIILLRFIHLLIRKIIPGNKKEYRPVHIRIVDLAFQILTVFCALFSFVFVFYFFEDWLLLSFTILFLAGLGWTTKTFLPKFWKQSQMMLNFGNVREGERVVLHGVPWLVKNINFRTKLENPTLGMVIKLPINDLLDKTSRPFNRKEPWFPCRKDDWVILSDGTRGCAVSVSHEQVELVLRGGACKTYQTSDFLKLAPLNLSRNFRIKEVFGIGYGHQEESTSSVLQKLEACLLARLEQEGYKQELLNLRVEFQSAGASSLDIVIIADFNGSQAPIYNRLRRAIQRWCVDACTENGWDIPFPQLTIHKGEQEERA